MNRPRRSNGTLRALGVRGVSAENFAVRPEIVLVEGRLFTPGLREAIVGRSAQTEFEGLELGAEVKLRDGVWTIVGVFTTGDATEAGLITDVDTLASAYGFGFVNSVTVRLESPAAFDELKAALDGESHVCPSTSTASPTTSRKTPRISTTCSSSSPTSSARSWRPARSSAR